MTRYEDRSKDELLQLAAEKNVEGRSAMTKPELVAALRGEAPATGAPEKPPVSPQHPESVDLLAVFDCDNDQIVAVFRAGTTDKERKDAAHAHIDRLAEHFGEGPARDLRVVKIKEV